MRTLSAALLAEQKKSHYTGLVMVAFSLVGHDSLAYFKNRILSVDHTEESWSHTARITLDNADRTLTALDLKGYQCQISWGMATSVGDEYANTSPLTVVSQENISQEGQLLTVIGCAGVPNMLSQDVARHDHLYSKTGTDTVKTIINDILTSNLGCYAHCPVYSLVWDSEDSLIDTFIPGDLFSINDKDNRLDKIKELLSYTGCVMRFGGDGDGNIHILNKTAGGTSYDYEYALSAGAHKFFSKTYRSRLIVPNYIYVSTPRDAAVTYFGFASDAGSFAVKPVIKHYEMGVVSNAQAANVAAALLAHYRLDAETGNSQIPMNVGQEIWDYVNITDSRASDSAPGNIQTINRKWNTLEAAMSMSFRFGTGSSLLGVGLADSGSSTGGKTSIDWGSLIAELSSRLDTLAGYLQGLINKLKTSWTMDFLRVVRRFVGVHGLDADKEIGPLAGSHYVAVDTERFYVCFMDGIWTWIGGPTLYFFWSKLLQLTSPEISLSAVEDHSGGGFTAAPSLSPSVPVLVIAASEDHSGGGFTSAPALITPMLTGNLYPAIIHENSLTEDGESNIYGANWIAQTFTPGADHNLNIFWLKLSRVTATAIGNITVSIRATAAGLPAGADLKAFSIDADGWLSTTARAMAIVIAPEALVSGTKYAFVVRAASGDAANYIKWRHHGSNPYAGGAKCSSADSGATWNEDTTTDMTFEEGEYI